MEGFQRAPVPGGTELAAGALGWAVTEQGPAVGGSGQCVLGPICGSQQRDQAVWGLCAYLEGSVLKPRALA